MRRPRPLARTLLPERRPRASEPYAFAGPSLPPSAPPRGASAVGIGVGDRGGGGEALPRLTEFLPTACRRSIRREAAASGFPSLREAAAAASVQ
uniref:Uncharacterized protein n=1 Tax=Oryza meridionalis TaxID=40149 RepID=A0A0E0E4E3_9ORYZ